MRRRSINLSLLVLLSLTSTAIAHPYHVSVAEVSVNHDEHRLEVGLRVFGEDLESALERRFGKRVDLERTEDVDVLITEYLRDVFRLGNPAQLRVDDMQAAQPSGDESKKTEEQEERFPLQWVGKEVEARDTWLFFTIALDREVEGLAISNIAMFEVQTIQENTIVVTDGEARVTMRCDREHPIAVVDFSAGKPVTD